MDTESVEADGNDVVTRFLCSAVYLDEDVARTVNQEIIKQPFLAVSPCAGTDVRAITRHAVQALDAMRERDNRLAWMMLAGAVGWLVLGSLDRFWPDLPFSAIGAGLLAVLLMTAAGLVWGYQERVRGHARQVMYEASSGQDMRDLAPPLDEFLEDKLGELAGGNVVAFRHGYPFVGSGRHLTSWTLVADVCRPASGPDGNPRRIEPFDVEALLEDLEGASGTDGLHEIRAQRRLYVHGASVAAVPGLLAHGPGVPQRPRVTVDDATLRQVALEPNPERRVYVCFEHTGWNSHRVVTLFVRCSRQGEQLVVEGDVCALLPLSDQVVRSCELPRSAGRERLQVALITLRWALPLLLGSPGRVLGRLRARRRFRIWCERQARQIQREEAPFNFGADASVRELVAQDDRYWHFASMDEQADARILQQRVFDRLVHFLSDRGVETRDLLDDQIRPIVWTWATPPAPDALGA